MVLFPLVSWISRKVGGRNKVLKLLISIFIILSFASVELLSVFKAREPSLYETLNVTRDTPSDQMKKKQREASLKYHPDKLKG